MQAVAELASLIEKPLWRKTILTTEQIAFEVLPIIRGNPLRGVFTLSCVFSIFQRVQQKYFSRRNDEAAP